MSDRYKKLLELSMSEDRINKILEAMPERPLKPGQSARITGKDNQELVKNIRQYISTHKSDINKLDRLEHQLNYYADFGLTPAQIEDFKQKIEDLKKFRDPKTHGYEKIIEEIVPIIKQRCSKYLPSLLASRFFLYRGMGPNEHKHRLAFRANSRNARRPLDSDPQAQNLFDKALQDLGFSALRSNSIFTTSDDTVFKSYGTGYLIFPTNEATFTWSQNRSDLIVRMEELEVCREVDMDIGYAQGLILERIHELSKDDSNSNLRVVFGSIKRIVDKDIVNPTEVKEIIQTIKMNSRSLSNFDEDLLDFLESLYNHSKEDQQKAMYGNFDIDIDKFQKKFAMNNKDFDKALDTGHEILIHGEYIAVISSFESLLKEALSMDTKDITEALKPGQIKPLTQFKKLDTGNNLANLQGQLNKLQGDLKYYKKLIAQYQKLASNQEKGIATVTKKLADPKLKKQAADPSFDKLVAFLQKNSGNYIKEMQAANRFLYRGMKSKKSVVHGRSWLTRKTMDSDQDEQAAFDQILEKLKIKARRGNSIFSTGDIDFASGYGELYLIFPYNSAAFSWSAKVKDLVLDPGDITSELFKKDPVLLNKLEQLWKAELKKLNQIAAKLKNKDNPTIKEEDLIYEINDINYTSFKDVMYDEEDFDSAVDEYKHLAKFKILKPIATNILEILNQFDKLPNVINSDNLIKFQKRYAISDEDLATALKKNGEILISGEYITVNAVNYGLKLAKALNIKDNRINKFLE